MHRPFGWKGIPGTCLWCGRRNPIFSLDRYSEGVSKMLADWSPEPKPGFKQIRVVGEKGGYRRFYFVKENARRGEHGDDHFCCRGCGEAFGVQCARDNIRMKVEETK